MTVHVLHAGDGYTYLTRQVAAGDNTVRRGEDLVSYYTAEGNPPGVWHGRGLSSLSVTGQVSEEQMKALFGEGLRPDADQFIRDQIKAGLSPDEAIKAARLGRKFMVSDVKDDGWDDDVRAAYAEFTAEQGRKPDVGPERDLIKTNLAADRLRASLNREATDAEVSTFLARHGQAVRQPVAGYDLVFTPVKSVSVLWGVADLGTAREVRLAHEAAWQGAIAWLEKEAAFTRVGAGGVAQMETTGLIATAFEHHDSRAGDPNLHTHVAVSTKVQGIDGEWRSLDGRILHRLAVSASEHYNMLIEHELRQRLGVTFQAETRGRNKRPVREIVGVPKRLRTEFSSRRAAIEEVYEQLLTEYIAAHGHTPTKAVQSQLAQKATLSTRQAKTSPKSLKEQRAEWIATTTRMLGRNAPERIVAAIKQPQPLTDEQKALAQASVEQIATAVIRRVENDRSTWQWAHLNAEAKRIATEVAATRPAGSDIESLVAEITNTAVRLSLTIAAPELNPVPQALQHQVGGSIYEERRLTRMTSERIIRVEDDLLEAATLSVGPVVRQNSFDTVLAQINAASEYPLDASQADLARRFATGGRLLDVGIGPAGTGKTTSMRVFARAVEADGYRVLALAPTAVAASVLAGEINVPAETAQKIVVEHRMAKALGRPVPEKYRIDDKTILLVDEAGMAATPLLGQLLDLAKQTGASIRLLGDPAQLAAVEAGGALRLLERRTDAAHLDIVYRFKDKAEAAATLLIREGDPEGLDFYVENGRTRGGLRQTMLEDIYAAWTIDKEAGKKSIMVAGTNEEVAALNARARLDLISAGTVTQRGVVLHDGNRAGVGDTIVTRLIDRDLRTNQGKDFVTNGDLWTVLKVEHGGLKVKSLRHGGVLTLPKDYVQADVELGYAATINRVQGITVDTSHILIDPEATSREQAYVAETRGAESNIFYVVTDDVLEVDGHLPDQQRKSIHAGLTKVLARVSAELSATETIEQELDQAASLARLIPQYEDAHLRVLNPQVAARMETLVRDALTEELAQRIVTDKAWTSLVTRLAAHEARGVDVTALLSENARPTDAAEDSNVRSWAKVFHHRVGAPATSAGPELPGWVTPVPPVNGTNTEVREWLRAQGQLIQDRIDDQIEAVMNSSPPWLSTLIDHDESPSVPAWWNDMASIVAYRDVAGVTDPLSPLGPKPRYPDPAFDDAATALQRLTRANSDSATRLAETKWTAAQDLLAVLESARDEARTYSADSESRKRTGPQL